MDKKSKEQTEYEDRLRYRLNILKEQLETGKVYIKEGLKVADSLKAVRYGPDGEIDLDTVDGLVRSLALGVEGMHNRQETKKIASLSEIQNAYFNFLYTNFSHFYEIMQKRKLTPHEAGLAATKSKATIEEVKSFMFKVLDYINEFWNEAGDIAQIHVEDMNKNIKGVFGGDLFPAHNENLASKCGIYTDTIILPDPFLRSKHIFAMQDDSQKVYYFIKHAMNLLQYKDLACTDLDVPIVVVLPDISALDKHEREFNEKLGKEDSLIHYAKLFGREFESFDEFMDFSSTLDTIERVLAEIKEPDRLLFDSSYSSDPKVQFQKMLDSTLIKNIGITHPGDIITNMSFGRMATSNELLIKSRRLGGVPIIDAPTSWQYFKWKLEYDSERMESATSLKDLHINKALQGLASHDMQWIGNIPSQALIEIRKEGAMDEIRHIISTDINKLIDINPNNFHRTQDQILENLQEAFKKHQENLNNLSTKKWKFAGQDIGSWLVIGGIEVAAALTGTPAWGLAGLTANQLFDPPKLKDIPKSIKDLKEENDKIHKSPVGVLFNIQQKIKI
jgi:hypothetical protein